MGFKRLLLNGKQMKALDDYSINRIKIPSLVLMERASLSVSRVINDIALPKRRIISVCSVGNNGADGICTARILSMQGYETAVCIIGDTRKATYEFNTQFEIYRNLGLPVVNITSLNEYDIIVDALFGIGLGRNIVGEYADAVNTINMSEKVIVSVDIPSGINPSNGQIMGCAVKADHTVTFGYEKTGIVLYPGKSHAGTIHVADDVGFAKECIIENECAWTFDVNGYKEVLPVRIHDSNKGNYGRVLVAAGSENMGGAAYFSACAAYRTGAGLVKVLTHTNNHNVIMNLLPEAVMGFYDKMNEEEIQREVSWSDVVVAGPGLSQNDMAVWLLESILLEDAVQNGRKIILDADALNIIASHDMKHMLKGTIITPHIGEMSRLTGINVSEIKKDIIGTTVRFAGDYGCICVLKDVRTIVSDGKDIYINTSGNNGMSTGGSGDVLTGIIAGLAAQKMDMKMSACLGVYIHGLSGDAAAVRHGVRSMTAGDILSGIENVLTG